MKRSQLINSFKFMPLLLAVGLTACGSSGSSSVEKPEAPNPTLSIDTIKSYTFSWSKVADATYYKLSENADGSSGFTQVGGNISSSATSYEHIVPLYNRLNAQYILEACNSEGCSSSSTIAVSPTTSELNSAIGYIKASNTSEYANFGTAVSISGDGLTLAIGAPGEKSNSQTINGDQTNTDGDDVGAVYVFSRSGANWTQQAYIKASDSENRDEFGSSVSLSQDGSTLAVGAPENAKGEIYIYTRSGTSWTEEAIVAPDTPVSGNYFGTAVSLSDDGDTLAAGGGKSKAYIFTRENTSWTQQQLLSGAVGTDLFGASLSLSGDGTTLALGARNHDTGFTNAGAVYVYTADTTGTWTQQEFLQASNATAEDNFGIAVSLSKDGSTLAVGSDGEDGNLITDDSKIDAGAVYLFTRTGTTWTQQAYIKASNVEAGDYFGGSVSLSSDGSTLAVGATLEDGETTGINTSSTAGDDNEQGGAGAVYVFTRSNTTWTQIAYVKATNSDYSGGKFGTEVSLDDDGSALVVGVPNEESNATGINSDQSSRTLGSAGAAYLY